MLSINVQIVKIGINLVIESCSDLKDFLLQSCLRSTSALDYRKQAPLKLLNDQMNLLTFLN